MKVILAFPAAKFVNPFFMVAELKFMGLPRHATAVRHIAWDKAPSQSWRSLRRSVRHAGHTDQAGPSPDEPLRMVYK